MVISHVYLTFDDVIFPTSCLSRYFNTKEQEFLFPATIRDDLLQLDEVIYTFICKHMITTHFRILTRANKNWLFAALRWLPQTRRLVLWCYVIPFFCQQMGKVEKIKEILSIDRDEGMTPKVILGISNNADDLDDLLTTTDCLRQMIKFRSILFIRRPDVPALLYQWEKITELFISLLDEPHLVYRCHFQPIDEDGTKSVNASGNLRSSIASAALDTIIE